MKRFPKIPIWCVGSPLGRSVIVGMALVLTRVWATDVVRAQTALRERISLNADWRFMKCASREEADDLI